MKTWLFHQTLPWKIFDIESDEQLEALYADGWVDTPAKLKPVEVKEPEPDTAPVALPSEAETLLAKFVSAPADLDKDQLITLGKAFNIEKLTRNMSEATLIKRIQDYLDGNSQ